MNRNLVFIALALFTWGMGESMFINFQPIYLAQLGSDPQQIGLILGAVGLTMAVTHMPAGHLADRIGRRPLLVAAWSIGFAAAVVPLVAVGDLCAVALLAESAGVGGEREPDDGHHDVLGHRHVRSFAWMDECPRAGLRARGAEDGD